MKDSFYENELCSKLMSALEVFFDYKIINKNQLEIKTFSKALYFFMCTIQGK